MKAFAAARAALLLAVGVAVAFAQSGYELYQKALLQERARGNLKEAIQLYERIVRDFASDRPLAAKALLHLGGCYEKLGRAEARKAYEQLLRDYADQGELATEARRRLRELNPPAASRQNSGLVVRRIAADFWNPVAVGRPSADGRYLPLISNATRSLAIRDLATGQDRPLLKERPYTYHFLSLSPDGKELAYRLNRQGRYELHVLGLQGGPPRVIYNGAGVTCLYPKEWSPDGKHILAEFLREDRTRQIALIAVGDGRVRVLKDLGKRGAIPYLSFSPDSRYVAYTREGDLYLLAADGTGEFPLVEHPANDSVLGWAPDGSGVLFASDRSGTWDTWFLPMTGIHPRGSPALIRKNTGQVRPVGLTPNAAFYYVVSVGSGDVYLAATDPASGRVLNGAGLATERFPGTNFGPAFSPTGRYLAFSSQRDAWRLCIQRLGDGERRELLPALADPAAPAPTLMGLHGSPDWSPDERALLVYGNDAEGNKGLYGIDAWTGEVKPIVQRKFWGSFRYPQWSGDGKAVFYVEYPEYWNCRILRHDLETGQERSVLDVAAPSGIGDLALSADGRQLAFLMGDDDRGGFALQIMPSTGGAVRELFRVNVPDRICTLAWTPDGRQLLFAWDRGAKKTELWRIPSSGGAPENLGLTMDQIWELRVHPDGRRIAFTGGGRKYELWVMENFLPVKAGN